MKNRVIYALLVLVGVFVVVDCMTKKQWQGTYVTVSYTSIKPKEDFMVAGYAVVAYDVKSQDKHSHVIYRFAIMRHGEKVGALEVTDFSQEVFAGMSAEGYEYCLVAGDIESGHDVGWNKLFVSRVIHRAYKNMPSYETVKNDVIDVVSAL
jgi:hypothetical protein